MSLSNRLYILLLMLLPLGMFAQTCSLVVSGYVTDQDSDHGLDYANVYIAEIERGVVTDSVGYFEITDLCPQLYTLTISHIGCLTEKRLIQLDRDTLLSIFLNHTDHMLEDIVIEGSSDGASVQQSSSIDQSYISDNAHESLSSILQSIVGVSTIKNGNGIAKPVIQGLYGNRLTILNHGVTQSGQQWGNDHSPEIDPMVANRIKVVKGAATLEYLGANLGGVILVEPDRIHKSSAVNGGTKYYHESNGAAHGLNLQVQQYTPSLAYKVNATWKQSGDRSTPSYLLTNTGVREGNIAIQLEKEFSSKVSSELYYSSFNTSIGILRGSHVSNLTDLEAALDREVPFFTRETFSYDIDAPRQQVAHHLLKAHTKYLIDEHQYIHFTAAAQLNLRKEYDVRRSGRSEIPSLSLNQKSLFVESRYHKHIRPDLGLRTGLQFNLIDNTNDPETGIFPLIPDYISYEPAAFVVMEKQWRKSLIEVGLRYNLILQEAIVITQTLPRQIIRYNNTYHNLSGLVGWKYTGSDRFILATNMGYATRSPAINELYSGGLHQGVSGIEEGNPDLQQEQSIKLNLELEGHLAPSLSYEVLFYNRYVRDYIFLRPSEEIRLTIRGAFPVFVYEQADVRIYGFDAAFNFQLSPKWRGQVGYSWIKGDNISDNEPLVFVPSNDWTMEIGYHLTDVLHKTNWSIPKLSLALTNRYVFKQNHLLTSQDFVEAPEAYNVLGLETAVDLKLYDIPIRFTIGIDNILNVSYRDYLNRQRYFADEIGRNIIIGIHVKF